MTLNVSYGELNHAHRMNKDHGVKLLFAVMFFVSTDMGLEQEVLDDCMAFTGVHLSTSVSLVLL